MWLAANNRPLHFGDDPHRDLEPGSFIGVFAFCHCVVVVVVVVVVTTVIIHNTPHTKQEVTKRVLT